MPCYFLILGQLGRNEHSWMGQNIGNKTSAYNTKIHIILFIILLNLRMWNQISCNKIIERKSIEKQKNRLLQTLRNTRSSLRSTNESRCIYRSASKSKIPFFNQQNKQKINKENRKIATRLEQIHRSKFSMSMDRMRINSSLLKSIDNNKRRISDSKQKSIQNANKKMLQKIVNANSTLKSIRMKTLTSAVNDKSKIKPILFMSNLKTQIPNPESSQQKQQKQQKRQKDKRKAKTEVAQVIQQQSVLESNISQSKVEAVEQEYPMEEQMVEEILDNN